MRDASPTARAGRLLLLARLRGRSGARGRLDEMRVLAPAVAQTALAAALAWLLARDLVGHAAPFFAPVAAIITLGVSYGQRATRAAEIAVGVAVGVLVSELLVLWLGRGAWQIALVVSAAMVAAILLGGRQLLVTQAAVSASLIATIATPSTGITLARFVDALCGGAAGLLVGLVLLPIDPMRLIRRVRPAVLEALSVTLEDVRVALREGDHDRAVDALGRARSLDRRAADYAEAAQVARQIATGAPLRRRSLPAIRREADAAVGLDLAVRGTRVLARGTLRAIDVSAHVPPVVDEALGDLVACVRAIGPALDDPDRHAEAARAAALAAAAASTAALQLTTNLALSAIVSAVRTTSADLLRALGEEEGRAAVAVRDVAERPR